MKPVGDCWWRGAAHSSDLQLSTVAGERNGRKKRPLRPNANYPTAREPIGTQVHSQQALIGVSFIQTTVFIEQGLSSGEQELVLL